MERDREDLISRRVTEVLADANFDDWLRHHQHNFTFKVYPDAAYFREDIGGMELSPRSYNCLRRAGINSVGDVIDLVRRPGDLERIRNCGAKSRREIKIALFLYQYSHIEPDKKREYQKTVMDMNS